MIIEANARNPYNYDVDAASIESGLKCEDVSRTIQSAKDEVDINTIVRRFGITGAIPQNVRAPTYGDFTGVRDFHEAANAIRSAAESFMEMPAEVRSRFQNDAGKFVDFCSDEANRDEMKKLGLLVPEVVVEPVEPLAVPPVVPPVVPPGLGPEF